MDSQEWLGFALVIAGGAVAASGFGDLIRAPIVGLGILVVFLSDSDQ